MCRTFQCSPPATTMWFQSSILWRSLDEFRKRSPTNGSRLFLIWTHRWLKKCLQGCSWNRVRPNHWWFQTEERRLKGVLQNICHWHGMYMRKFLTLNSPNWTFFLKEFSLKNGASRSGSLKLQGVLMWSSMWPDPTCWQRVRWSGQWRRDSFFGKPLEGSLQILAGDWPMNLWLKETRVRLVKVVKENQQFMNLYTFSSSAKKDGWVAPQFFVFGWGASGCLHLVQGTLCGCQYGGWKGWWESIFQGLQHSSK